MKTQIYQTLTTYEIPGGEGSTALPISFNSVIARGVVCDDTGTVRQRGEQSPI